MCVEQQICKQAGRFELTEGLNSVVKQRVTPVGSNVHQRNVKKKIFLICLFNHKRKIENVTSWAKWTMASNMHLNIVTKLPSLITKPSNDTKQ